MAILNNIQHDLLDELTNVFGTTPTIPADTDEWYCKGTFIDESGDELYYEVPAIFDANGNINVDKTIEKVYSFIRNHNELVIRQIFSNGN